MKTVGDFKIPQKGDTEATGWSAEQEANDTSLALIMGGARDGSSVGSLNTRFVDTVDGTNIVFTKEDTTEVVSASIDATGELSVPAVVALEIVVGGLASDVGGAVSDASSAVILAQDALGTAQAAQADATQALSDASTAQADASQALFYVSAAQGDATQALADASSAQADATQASADASTALAGVTGIATNVTTAFLSATDGEVGTALGKTTFDEGRPNFSGTAITWEDINYDPTMLTGTGSLPTSIALGATGCNVAAFSGSQTDSVAMAMEIPHRALLNNPGETSVPVEFHFHCYPTTAGATNRNIRVQLERVYTVEGVVVGSSVVTIETFTLPVTAWERKSFSFVAFAAPERLGTQMFFKFSRLGGDVADTYTGDLAVATIGLHYQSDSMGSRSTTVK
jgi:hypothetical protein